MEISYKKLHPKIIKFLNSFTLQNLSYFIPLALWWIMFQCYQFTPLTYRPTIDVNTLPLLERSIFGGLLHEVVPRFHGTGIFDLMAASVYAVHFIAPWTFMFYLWRTNGQPLLFIWSLGWLNILAVATHAIFPTAPPWYFERYGTSPATYTFRGEPAGLQYADQILKISMFDNIYSNSPVVFGSFPSLHAAWPFMIACYAEPNSIVGKFTWLYVLAVWWAALYLKHHYMVDLIGGALYVLLAINLSSIFMLILDHICLWRDKLFFTAQTKKKEKDEDFDIETCAQNINDIEACAQTIIAC